MQQILNEALAELQKHYPAGSDEQPMTDLLVSVNPDSGLLTISDDDDTEIYSAVVEDWIGADTTANGPVAAALRASLSANRELLDTLSLPKPYSVLLIDEDRETVCELYLADDQTIVLDCDTLMQGLDQDLDNFFDNLMKE